MLGCTGALASLRAATNQPEYLALTVKRGRFPTSETDGTRFPSSSYTTVAQVSDFSGFSLGYHWGLGGVGGDAR